MSLVPAREPSRTGGPHVASPVLKVMRGEPVGGREPADDNYLLMVYELLTSTHPAWHRRAACRGLPTAWFFPTRDEGDSHEWAIYRVCPTCPVRALCLHEGMTQALAGGQARKRKMFGQWGGLTARAVYRYRRALFEHYGVDDPERVTVAMIVAWPPDEWSQPSNGTEPYKGDD